jgi:lipopolysaccharide export system protein LptA
VVDSIGDISTVNSITIGATESVSIKSGSITLNSDKFTVANTGAITSKAGITLNGSISGVKTEINGTSYNIINVNNISASGTITGDKGVYNAVWN